MSENEDDKAGEKSVSDLRCCIDLWQLHPIVGIIVAHPSGVVYTNQTGGYSTCHPSMEGVFVPLPRAGALQAALDEHFFDGPKWEGSCARGITVNRDHLRESMEAWIHLTIGRHADDDTAVSGLDGNAAVLTWENSD